MNALLLLLLPLTASAISPETALSAKTEKEFARLEEVVSQSQAARRLFAATRKVPRREARGVEQPDAIGVRGDAVPELVFDAKRLPETSETDAEILLILNLARAELAFQVPIVEAEQAAWQKTLVICAELGAADPAGFGATLARVEREQGRSQDALERSALPPRTPWEPSETPTLKLPKSPSARAGLLLHLLDGNPQRFYWAVEGGTAWPRTTARLAELEDLYALRAKEIAALKAAPDGPYATLGGRRYAAPLVRAAFLLRGTGEVERLREALEAYDTVGLASARLAINRWRRSVAK